MVSAFQRIKICHIEEFGHFCLAQSLIEAIVILCVSVFVLSGTNRSLQGGDVRRLPALPAGSNSTATIPWQAVL